MKRIALTLAIWLSVASALCAATLLWAESFHWYVACMNAQSDLYVMQHTYADIHQNTTLAELNVAAACGMQHGVVPVQTAGAK